MKPDPISVWCICGVRYDVEYRRYCVCPVCRHAWDMRPDQPPAHDRAKRTAVGFDARCLLPPAPAAGTGENNP